MMFNPPATALLSLLLVLLAPASALAQEASASIQVEHFEPMPKQGVNVANIATADVLGHLQLSAGLLFHYGDSELVLLDDATGRRVELVEREAKGEIWFGMGGWGVVDLGVILPVVFYQSGDLRAFGHEEAGKRIATIGDTRLVLKGQLLDPDDAYGFGAAALGTLYLPTGDDRTFNSDGAFRAEPRLVVDWRHPVGLLFGVNLGYQFRPQRQAFGYVSDDMIRYGAVAMVPTGWDVLQVVGTLFGSLQTVGDGPQWGEGAGEPVEAMGLLQFSFPDDIILSLGAGAGLSEGVGAPDWRGLVTFGYAPVSDDRDGDGISDDDDRCIYTPEDLDGNDDDDGCPDDDDDRDGIADVDDACPQDREDRDGKLDDDGCPDPDNDADGIADVDDACPDQVGPRHAKGCPQGDRDGDGVGDDTDRCPDEAEDRDGFDDADGCLDGDNDFDGIPDDADRCPNQAEVFDGLQDEDGCPEDAQSRVQVTGEKIVITEKVHFDTGSARIDQRSFGVLRELAATLKANPQIEVLRIEGHTDSRGSEATNQRLSQARAEAVRDFLVEQGVGRGRLEARGYGESQPIETNETSEGREANRRVEFTITKRP